MPISLAWKNLVHDKRKLLVALSGITFAVMLMFQQRGFNHALFDSTVQLVNKLDADLILFSEARFALSSEMRFDRSAIDLARGLSGVRAAYPVYIENLAARLRQDGSRARPIRVISFDLDSDLYVDFNPLKEHRQKLAEAGTAIIDQLSKRNYGFVLNRQPFPEQSGELAGKRIRIVGTFELGRDFAHDGNLIMSLDNFVNYFPTRGIDPTEKVDLGAIQISSQNRAHEIKRQLTEVLPPGIQCLTRQEFIDREIRFWSRNTPIGIIFAVGSMMGFAVGVIICYQVLANNIGDNLRELATLKAMGYGSAFFFRLVLIQSILLSLIGFLPGLVLSLALFQINSSMTGLAMVMTWDRAGWILVLTITMCVLSGFFALRKLLRVDPANLF